MGNVLLKNVRPVPKPEDLPAIVSILLSEDGKISALVADEDEPPEAEVIDVKGAYVSPGWIDLHTHIYYGATDISVRPDAIGVATGVTTLVDTGSAGEANFHGFREFIAGQATEDIFALLNIGSIGLVACNRVSELQGIASIDLDRAIKVVEENRDIIKGIKIRASHVITGSWGITPLKLAKKLSRIVDLPLMVHIGEPPPILDEVLNCLDEGDIVTHCFNSKAGGNIFDDSHVFATAIESHERGIIFDVGHGGASFSYRVAEDALARGLKPHTISTDLHDHNIRGPVYDLATTMSKLFSLGLTLTEVIDAVTNTPSRVLGLRHERDSWLREGAQANLTIFELIDTDVALPDSDGQLRTLNKMFMPRYTAFGGKLFKAASRYFSNTQGLHPKPGEVYR